MNRFIFQADSLRNFVEEMFSSFGIPQADCKLAADVLAYSDEHGIDSHGVARLITYYELLKLGRINCKPHLKIVREKGSVATVDGDNGLGLIIGPKCNEIAMDKAELHGSGWVSVCNTNHYGAAGYYPWKALERDLIGLSLTNTTKGVAPFGGREKMLGTNPIAIAFPAGEEPPMIIDMATSAVAYGKVEIAYRRQRSMPLRWCMDQNGVLTSNPEEMIHGGALLPLGSDSDGSGHKGYCLAAMVDVLSAVLSGANWGPFAIPFAIQLGIQPERQVGKGIGHFFGAWDVSGFQDLDVFKRSMDDWIRTMRKTAPLEGTKEVLIPGDPERLAYQARTTKGIPLDELVWENICKISRETGIPLPSEHSH
nr:Ldh family oxidoreductase [Cytophagales bacterium]